MTQNAHRSRTIGAGVWPLREMLRRGPSHPDTTLTFELNDAVAFDSAGTAAELLQVRHHIGATKGMGDVDVDLWKTLARFQ